VRDRKRLYVLLMGAAFVCGIAGVGSGASQVDQTEAMRDSLVCVVSSVQRFNVTEPWKRRGLSDRWACGSAVGPYQVITTAQSVANHTFVKVLRYGQAEYIRAAATVIDYESDLCLIELDRDELREPLKPLRFAANYAKGQDVTFHWLAVDGGLNSGQGYLDRAHAERVRTSYGRRLRYVIANASQKMGRGELYQLGSTPVGIGCWAGDNREADLIPGETIARFLEAAADGRDYPGFGEIGFAASELRDPAMRSFLQMPESLRGGVYVGNVYHLGTGAQSLLKGDVVLDLDGHAIDSYGRYEDPLYGPLSMQHLITRQAAGEEAVFTVWREGAEKRVSANVENFKPSDMLVPFHEYDQQPEYVIIGGFVFQKLTREYLLEFGKNLAGQAPSHLYHYYRDLAFKPTEERESVVVLSHVLPTPTNLGYTGLGELVVKAFNGLAIGSVADIVKAGELKPDAPHHIVEFEMNAPTVVIPRARLSDVDRFVSKNYGIRELSNIRPSARN
jgi:PDZ domain-containing protein